MNDEDHNKMGHIKISEILNPTALGVDKFQILLIQSGQDGTVIEVHKAGLVNDGRGPAGKYFVLPRETSLLCNKYTIPRTGNVEIVKKIFKNI